MMQAQPQQTVVVPATSVQIRMNPDPPGVRPRYAAKTSKILGWISIFLGVGCVVLNIVGIAIEAGVYFVGHGIWCGIFYVLSGAFGVAAGNTKRTCYIVTFMVLTIITATIFVVPVLTASGIGLSFDSTYYYYGSAYHHLTPNQGKLAVNGLLIAMALTEGIIAIISSAICCGGLCCASASQGTIHTNATVQYNQATGQQMVILALPGQQFPAALQQPGGVAVQPMAYTYTTNQDADSRTDGHAVPGLSQQPLMTGPTAPPSYEETEKQGPLPGY